MDSDLQKQLEEIALTLKSIEKKQHPSFWRAFFSGIIGALGYVVGVAVVVVMLGWFLAKTGLLTAFQKQMQDFQYVVDRTKQLLDVGKGGGK